MQNLKWEKNTAQHKKLKRKNNKKKELNESIVFLISKNTEKETEIRVKNGKVYFDQSFIQLLLSRRRL